MNDLSFLYTKAGIDYIRKKYGFKNSKSLGQNFLADESVIDAIIDAAEIGPEDFVVEIGPGLGVLTAKEARRAGKVCAVELDRALIPILRDLFGGFPNVEIRNEDILKVDLMALIADAGMAHTKIIGNLPYYITTPILMALLEKRVPAESITVMMQKEVADRVTAPPGGRTYGALSVACQYYARVREVVQVPKEAFVPAPKVDSTVLRLDLRQEPAVKVADEALFFRLVKAGFAQRRKTLLNSLTGAGFGKETIKAALQAAGIDPVRRAETLSLEDFGRLTDAFAGE